MASSRQKHQSNFDAALFGLTLDRGASTPLHVQLIDRLRAMLGELEGVSGLRLPSSRALAAELSVSRMTVTSAYDQLMAEGYLAARRGAGTFVSDHLPHLVRPAPRETAPAGNPAGKQRPWAPFQTDLSDQSLFPHKHWARHLERAWRDPEAALLNKADAFGWRPLREAISAHLSAWRGLEASPEQIIVTSGAWEAFDIICNALIDKARPVVVEDPGWASMRRAVERAGCTANPVRIDQQGLDPAMIPSRPAAVIVTPSRHYPTGIAMPLGRRLELLERAERDDALVIEDDYDSEFRYEGQPLPSLSGLDGLLRTAYIGSYSKLLSPALRLGYLVVPQHFAGAVRDYLSMVGLRASLVPQPALASFMQSGEFAAHLRRMRRTYAKRQKCLVEALSGAAGMLEIRPDPSGMHLCLPLLSPLRERVSDLDIQLAARAQGLGLRALSSHASLPEPPQGLLLGYAGFDEEALNAAAAKLTGVLNDMA
ncbi:MocR-like pyridoxine biosynthesis transcription factor PdxR [Cucumibacter marinus]|uniref:MocR-like pyridoxine biosynthesis transcription factor PdxR n=1 Tax=Cucumibacter marinus TaxID=1121252 RepID=UPI00040017D6|nr:PLP-dependent aminotransferase family protein [Cucumibacter marinus]